MLECSVRGILVILVYLLESERSIVSEFKLCVPSSMRDKIVFLVTLSFMNKIQVGRLGE